MKFVNSKLSKSDLKDIKKYLGIMALSKYSHQSDQVADLYRAAFYLAKGSKEVGVGFLRKSRNGFEKLLKDPEKYLSTDKGRFYWSEKILDEDIRLRYKISLVYSRSREKFLVHQSSTFFTKARYVSLWSFPIVG